MKPDITRPEDVKLLVDEFYKKVVLDDVIGVFFTKIIQLDFIKHMPVMYSFWEMVLLGGVAYKGNPMMKHIELDKKKKLTEVHFNRWLKLWTETIDEYFAGTKSEEAKLRAGSVAGLMQVKINEHNQIKN